MTARPPGSEVKVRVRVMGGREARAEVCLGWEGEAPATQQAWKVGSGFMV